MKFILYIFLYITFFFRNFSWNFSLRVFVTFLYVFSFVKLVVELFLFVSNFLWNFSFTEERLRLTLLVKKSSKELVKPLGKKTTSVRSFGWMYWVFGWMSAVPAGCLNTLNTVKKITEKTDPRCVAWQTGTPTGIPFNDLKLDQRHVHEHVHCGRSRTATDINSPIYLFI